MCACAPRIGNESVSTHWYSSYCFLFVTCLLRHACELCLAENYSFPRRLRTLYLYDISNTQFLNRSKLHTKCYMMYDLKHTCAGLQGRCSYPRRGLLHPHHPCAHQPEPFSRLGWVCAGGSAGSCFTVPKHNSILLLLVLECT